MKNNNQHTVILNFIKDIQKLEINLYENKLDALDIIFSSVFFNKTNYSLDCWIKKEKERQLNKALLNKIGILHEDMGESFSGWEKIDKNNEQALGHGFDLINKQKKIIIELKNKWNTFNSNSKKTVYDKGVKFVLKNSSWCVYVVYIIPKNGKFCKLFVDKESNTSYKNLKCIDGDTFYTMVSGDKNFFKNLVTTLVPKWIEAEGIRLDVSIYKYLKDWHKETYKNG